MSDKPIHGSNAAPGSEASSGARPHARVRCTMLTVWALAGALFLAAPGYGAGTRTLDIEVRNGKVVGKNSVRVTRGDMVQLRWVSDKPLELHLHGYDVTVRVVPGSPAEMKLRAHATGRFPVEIHGEKKSSGGHGHKPLYFLEVYPD